MSERVTLAGEIKAEALRLGFDRVGIAPSNPIAGADADFFDRWLARQHHGEMAYLSRDPAARKDASRLLPGAKSVVAVAMVYATNHQDEAEDDEPRGRISSYARGEDYHAVLKRGLDRLLAFVEHRRPGSRGKVCVDTSPVLDRAYAYRAGLGWWGKNTLILAEDLGSYFFLGELILDLELEFDSPRPDRCGSCTRCLDACPTQAFEGPGDLDSRRCLSYLTIELRGGLPSGAPRGAMTEWLFGCDVCQEVCPWNRDAPKTTQPAFESRVRSSRPSLPAVLSLRTDAEFRREYGETSLVRARRRGLLRNAAVLLGARREARGVDALIGALEDIDPVIREEAARALARIGTVEAREALQRRAGVETDAAVRASLADFPGEGSSS